MSCAKYRGASYLKHSNKCSLVEVLDVWQQSKPMVITKSHLTPSLLYNNLNIIVICSGREHSLAQKVSTNGCLGGCYSEA